MRLALALMFWAVPAGAECRLALALAMDGSRSIDAADFAIQTEGLAAALEDPAVRQAILAGEGAVALAVYQWSGAAHPDLLQDRVLVSRIRAGLDFTRLTVNALAIGEHDQGLLRYFQTQLSGGPGAFVEVAPRQIVYPQVIRRKLLRALAAPK